MPRDGLGNYTLPAPDIANGQVSDATDFNLKVNDIASALTDSFSSDGQTPATGNQNMASFRHLVVGNAQQRNEYAAAGQVQDGDLCFLTGVAGTNTITASIAPAITTYNDGQIFNLIPANSNTGATTININALGAKNIWLNGLPLVGYEIRKNCPIVIFYDGTQFHLIGGAYGGDGIPIGEVKALTTTLVPNRHVLLYGQAVNRIGDFADYFAIVGTLYGAGNGTTTFNLPDWRGRTPFGKDDMGGVAANRITNAVSNIAGTTLGAVGGSQSMQQHTHTGTTGTQSASHYHNGTTDAAGAHAHSVPASGSGGAGFLFKDGADSGSPQTTDTQGTHAHTYTTSTESGTHTHAITMDNTGAGSSENMPPATINNWIMKY